MWNCALNSYMLAEAQISLQIGAVWSGLCCLLEDSIKGHWYTFKGDNSVKVVFAPFWKGTYSKRKEFAPIGSKFFPFRVDPFQIGTDVQERKQELTKVVSLVKKWQKNY